MTTPPRTRLVLSGALALAVLAALPAAAQERTRVGIIPFDVASVDGGTAQAATAMAKLVRAQMVTNRALQPVLIELAGDTLPLQEDRLAALAEAHKVSMIVAGTILDASTTRGSNRISTGSLGGAIGVGGVGGSMTKTRAEVRIHAELVRPDGRTLHAMEIEGNNTDVGLGADLWTTLGSFDVGEANWDQSPMGKALREAAQKLTNEVVKRRK
jgi:hypothetical protein